MQEVRATNRFKYLKVLGTKNPADVLTKYVPAELLGRHLEVTGMTATDGRAAAALELNSLESVLFWCEAPHEKKVLRFAATVSYRAVPAVGKGFKVERRGGGEPPVSRELKPEEPVPAPRTLRRTPRVRGPRTLEARNSFAAPDIKAKENDMWERLVVEAKATKRQWADIEDSDEEARAPNVVVVR